MKKNIKIINLLLTAMLLFWGNVSFRLNPDALHYFHNISAGNIVLAALTPEDLPPETRQQFPNLFPQNGTSPQNGDYKLTPPSPYEELEPSWKRPSPGEIQPRPGEITPKKGVFKLPNPLGVQTITDLVDRIAGYLIVIAAPIVTIMILFAAFQILTAGDNPEKLKTAKQMILWTVVGYGIILISKGITLIIKELLGG
jgi:hypothetical protein